jgi:hypothetical protein
MVRGQHFPTTPIAEDIGDDSDLSRLDQPYTADDIDAILNASGDTVEERRALLLQMLDDLQARRGMEEGREDADLLAEIRNALAILRGPPEGIGPDTFYGDTDVRQLAPDEILERAEEEAEEDRPRS